jgi:predicted HTH transcriptional regulator
MDELYYKDLIQELINNPKETEWFEFKLNNENPDAIGEYISALSNSAAYSEKQDGYLIWGIDNDSHKIIGTEFSPKTQKIGGNELENWLLQHLEPKINFHFHNIQINELQVVVLEIERAYRYPVQFKNIEYIRIGSIKKKLKDFPEKERELWRKFENTLFEKQIAYSNAIDNKVLELIDYPEYFNSLRIPLPENKQGILESLYSESLIKRNEAGNWDITNLGAILFAKQLKDFSQLERKNIRLIFYKNTDKVITEREIAGTKGYVSGFSGLIDYIVKNIPSNEIISGALRKELPMFPELSIRELIANALIHQDFLVKGSGPMIEIYPNRMEITNPGIPLIRTDRFLDSPPKSRNELLASFMRRVGFCEERGSGIDKVVFQTEFYQLPAPVFEIIGESTRSVIFSHKEFREMYKEDKIRACYLHSCLKYVKREFMTNTSLRERFGIDERNSAQASRIIKDSIEAELIKCYDDTVGSKARRYVPFWA